LSDHTFVLSDINP